MTTKRDIPASSAAAAPPKFRFRWGAPELILAIALTLSLAATAYVERTTRNAERLQFESAVRETNASIEQRIGVYAALLNGGRGLLAARGGQIDRAAFRTYADQLGAPMRDPGIAGLGYIQRVAPGGEASLVASMRAQGYTEFHFTNAAMTSSIATASSGDLFAILYLEPESATNQRGIGLNPLSEPVRRAAMEVARDTGHPVASGRVVSLRPTPTTANQPLFLIYLPIYAEGTLPTTVAERRARLTGFVYCPFRSKDMLHSTLETTVADHHIDVEVFDGKTTDDASLLYRSKGHLSADAKESAFGPAALYERDELDIAGRPWTIVCCPGVGFDGMEWTPYVLFGGIAISALLFGIARAQSNARTAAESATGRWHRSDAALQVSEARAQRLIESNIIGVLRADFHGRVLEANDAFLSLSGWTREDLERGTITLDALTPTGKSRGLGRILQKLHDQPTLSPFETALQSRAGARVPVVLGATRVDSDLETADGKSSGQFIAFLLDITERKDAERQIRDNEARQRAFFRDVLSSVTEGRLRLCDTLADLPMRSADSNGPITLTPPALRAVRHTAQRAAHAAAMSEERMQDMITAVGEAGMNAVVHAGGGVAWVSGGENGTVQIWIEDRGKGIDMQRLPKATLERGYTTAGSLGHGFWLMLKTVDRLWLLTGPNGTTVVLEQDATLAEPSWIADRMKGGVPEEVGVG